MVLEKSLQYREKAEELADVFLRETRILKNMNIEDAGLGMVMNLARARYEEDYDYETLSPNILEIMLFGSVARGDDNPSDIDLIIIDNGHFSDSILVANKSKRDMYLSLPKNIDYLMEMFFAYDGDEVDELLDEISVDLHALPIKFLKSKDFRSDIAKRHKDSNFFKNVFGEALRYDFKSRKFERAELGYFEEKYDCELNDLKQES